METIVWVVHVIAAFGVIGLVLLQHGKGADMGAAFGSGASGSLFGVTGSANLLSRATAGMVTVFFITSLSLAYLSSHSGKHSSVVKMQQVETQVPATDKAAGDASTASSKSKDVPQ
jgi:preprotein translocase subunit SecG